MERFSIGPPHFEMTRELVRVSVSARKSSGPPKVGTTEKKKRGSTRNVRAEGTPSASAQKTFGGPTARIPPQFYNTSVSLQSEARGFRKNAECMHQYMLVSENV